MEEIEKVNNENLEDAEKTLEAIREEKKPEVKRGGIRRFFAILAKPFVSLFKQIKKVRIPITVKMVMIYSSLFIVTLAVTVAFIIGSVKNHLVENGVLEESYITNLIVTGVILILIDVALVVSLGSIASTVMLGPVRKMIKKIDGINPDDLSARLDKVDSAGEIGELTDRINEMLDKIEQSVGRQKKFISDASHELKTPIAVIQGYSNLLQRWGKDDPEVLNESIDSIAREAERMKKITEQLLFLAKIGRFVLTKEEVELKSELTALAESYAVLNENREIKLIASGEVRAKLDKAMFVECVRAVVDNAVKYSDEDKAVIIRLYRSGNDAVVSVEDKGRGISKEDLPLVFERFYRCDKARRRNEADSSCGLGLTIAKSVVETMGGTIGVESEEGKGSTFTLRFPIEEGEVNE